MGRQVVHDDDVARRERRHENLLDIGPESHSVHRPVKDHRRGHAGEPERPGERRSFPMTVRNARSATLSARRATAKSGHLRGKTRLVYEDEAGWIEIKLCIEPVLTPLQEVWPLLLQCMCGLFLNVRPRLRSQTSRVLRPIETDRSSSRRKTISFSVMSFDASIMPMMKAS